MKSKPDGIAVSLVIVNVVPSADNVKQSSGTFVLSLIKTNKPFKELAGFVRVIVYELADVVVVYSCVVQTKERPVRNAFHKASIAVLIALK